MGGSGRDFAKGPEPADWARCWAGAVTSSILVRDDGSLEVVCGVCCWEEPANTRSEAIARVRDHDNRHHGGVEGCVWSGIVDGKDYDVDFVDDDGIHAGHAYEVWLAGPGTASSCGLFAVEHPPEAMIDDHYIALIRAVTGGAHARGGVG